MKSKCLTQGINKVFEDKSVKFVFLSNCNDKDIASCFLNISNSEYGAEHVI